MYRLIMRVAVLSCLVGAFALTPFTLFRTVRSASANTPECESILINGSFDDTHEPWFRYDATVANGEASLGPAFNGIGQSVLGLYPEGDDVVAEMDYVIMGDVADTKFEVKYTDSSNISIHEAYYPTTNVGTLVVNSSVPFAGDHRYSAFNGDVPYISVYAQSWGSLMIITEVRLFSGCGESNIAPTAVASGLPTVGTYPLTVSFDATGSTDDSGIVSWEWDFGNGDMATGETVDYTYTEEGDFTAELTVTDVEGLTDTDTVIIEVNREKFAPTADVVASAEIGDYPLSVDFDGSGSTDEREIVAWNWDFGDGITGTGETVNHVYEDEGVFLAELTVIDDDGLFDRADVTITVERPLFAPDAAMSATPTNGDYPLDVEFDGSGSSDERSIVSWEWDFGDGGSASGETVSYTYEDEGEFTAELTVIDDDGLSNKTSLIITVERPLFAPDAAMSATPTNGDYPLDVEFDGSGSSDERSIVSWEWDFGDGGSASGETVSYTYESEGEFIAELTVTDDDGLTDVTSVTITVERPLVAPSADISATPINGDYPLDVTFDGSGSSDDRSIVSWDWGFGDGGSASGETVSYTYEGEGEFTAELTVTDDDGLTDSTSVTITVERPLIPPIAAATATPTEGSYPLDVAFDGSASSDERSIVAWDWDFGDGGNASGETVSYIYEGEGEFSAELTVTDDDGLTDTISVAISVLHPLISPTALITSSAPSGVVPHTVAFDGNGSTDERNIVDYAWDFGDGTTASGATAAHIYDEVGLYSAELTVTDDDGLTDSTAISITVEAAPLISPTAQISASDIEGTLPLLVQLSGSESSDEGSIVTWDWDFGDGATGSGETVLHTYTEAGEFSAELTVTDNDGLTDTSAISITVNAPLVTPTANIIATPIIGTLPLEVNFNGAGSSDEVGIVSYAWAFGDGITDTGVIVDHTYTDEGLYAAELTVTDDDGLTDTISVTITVEAPLITPTAHIVADVTSGIVPFDVDFDGSGSSDGDGSIVSYAWDFGDGTTGSGSTISHTFTTSGTFTVALTVTDDVGLIDSVTELISAEEDTSPCGTLLLNGDFSGGNANWTRHGSNISGGQAIMGPGYGAIEQTVNAVFEAGSLFSYAIEYTVVGPLIDSRFQLEFTDTDGNTVLHNYTPTSASGTFITTEYAPVAGAPQNSSYNGVTAAIRVYLEGKNNSVLTVDSINVQRFQCDGNEAEAPTALFDATLDAGNLMLRNFDASASNDDGAIISYDWSFGDGTVGSGEIVSHTYSSEGAYLVELTVIDDLGLSDSETQTIVVDDNVSTCGELLQNGSFAADGLFWQSFSAQYNSGQAQLGSVYGAVQQSATGVFDAGTLITLEVDYTIAGPLSGARFQVQFTDDANNSIVRWYSPTEVAGTFSITEPVPDAFDPINSSFNGQTREIGVYLEGKDGTLLTVDAARLQYNACSNGATAPTAEFEVLEGLPGESLSLAFDASGSPDDGTIVEYKWDMGDGTIVMGATPVYTYAAEGTYTVVLTVKDDDGLYGRTSQDVYVEEITANFTIIEIANISGVSGYDVGIFGSGFGSRWNEGTVSILGTSAEISEWSDGFVRVIVPSVADGGDPEGLLLTTSTGITATSPFTVYTIAETWLTPPETTFTNVSHGKPVTLSGVDANHRTCYDYQSNFAIDASSFLTNYRCGFGSGAKFGADITLGTEGIIEIDMETPLAAGEYLFQFFSRPDWTYAAPGSCGASGYPLAYQLEASTNGSSWTSILSVADNGRGNRSHYVTMPDGSRFVRMRVTDSVADCSTAITAKDFEINYVELHQVNGSSTNSANAIAIYGDSLTYAAFSNQLGPVGLNARVQDLYPSEMPFTAVGLIGRKASGLNLDYAEPNELEDVYNEDAIASSAFYWGLALGTNDMNLADIYDQGYTLESSQFNMFEESMSVDGVEWLIAQGHAPIIARIPDTNEDDNGYGFIEAKVQILNAIDRMAAKYQLIPGPDLYTEFRLNLERNQGTWVGNDGTHHTISGQDQVVQQWADALSDLSYVQRADASKGISQHESTPTSIEMVQNQSQTRTGLIWLAFLPLVAWSVTLLIKRNGEAV